MRNEKSKKNSPLVFKQRQAPMVSTQDFKQQPFSLFSFLFSLLYLFSLLSCSSSPRPVPDIYTVRNMTVQRLNLASQTANRGFYEDALLIAEEACSLAISADDPSLRIQSSISRGNILFSLGRQDLAFEDWEFAAAEAEASGENVLAAQARIFSIRASLVLLANDETAAPAVASAAATEFKAELDRLFPAVRQDLSSSALWHVTLGLAEKQLENWTDAESSIRRALDIHERNLKLEDAAYAWFLIASIRSIAGNYDSALEALNTSIRLDRRVENGYGLANSWQAMGDVYDKAGRSEESLAAWHRAAEIFRAIGLEDRAELLQMRNEKS